jgi:hypothetical protein
MPLTFSDYIAERVGTRKWVVAARLTPRLKAKGYEAALSPTRYSQIEHEYRCPHGYDAEAVNAAIESSRRHGNKIASREARLIHSLLQGRR